MNSVWTEPFLPILRISPPATESFVVLPHLFEIESEVLRMTNRRQLAVAALGFGAVLALGACGTDTASTTTTSDTSTSVATTSSVAASSVAPAATTTSETSISPHNLVPRTQVRDDDPGGKPCTDQSGAKGHYIWADSSNQWVCQITQNAPRPAPAPTHHQAPANKAGQPCTDQSGMKGHYIWSPSSKIWVCQIS